MALADDIAAPSTIDAHFDGKTISYTAADAADSLFTLRGATSTEGITVEGDNLLTFDSSVFNVSGNIHAAGIADGTPYTIDGASGAWADIDGNASEVELNLWNKLGDATFAFGDAVTVRGIYADTGAAFIDKVKFVDGVINFLDDSVAADYNIHVLYADGSDKVSVAGVERTLIDGDSDSLNGLELAQTPVIIKDEEEEVQLPDSGNTTALVPETATGTKVVKASDNGDTLINQSTEANVTLVAGAGEGTIVAAGGENEVVDLSAGGSTQIIAENGANVQNYNANTNAAFRLGVDDVFRAIITQEIVFGDSSVSLRSSESEIAVSGETVTEVEMTVNIASTKGDRTRVTNTNSSGGDAVATGGGNNELYFINSTATDGATVDQTADNTTTTTNTFTGYDALKNFIRVTAEALRNITAWFDSNGLLNTRNGNVTNKFDTSNTEISSLLSIDVSDIVDDKKDDPTALDVENRAVDITATALPTNALDKFKQTSSFKKKA